MQVYVIEIGYCYQQPHKLCVVSSVEKGRKLLETEGWSESSEFENLWTRLGVEATEYARFCYSGLNRQPLPYELDSM